MMSAIRGRVRLAGALAGGLLLFGCASGRSIQPGQAVPGVALGGGGNQVKFGWAPDSPVAGMMQYARSSRLVASYPSKGGQVTGEQIATARMESANVAVYDLPRALRNPPTGPVCLRIISGRQSVPLRYAGGSGSTDGFRYMAWEPLVSRSTQLGILEKEKAAVERNLATLEQKAEPFREWQAREKIGSVGACETIQAGVDTRQPKTAVAPAQQYTEARRQCVYQFNETVRYFYGNDYSAAGFVNAMTASLSAARQSASSPVRRAQLQTELDKAQELGSDVARFPEALRLYYDARLHNDFLPTTTSADKLIEDAGGEVNQPIASAMLDAHTSCVTEAQKQFQQSYNAWKSETSTNLLNARAEVLRRDCRTRFNSEAERVTELRKLEQRRTEIYAEMSAVPSAGAPPASQFVSLLDMSCY